MSHRLVKRLSNRIKRLKAENRSLRQQLKAGNFMPNTGISDADLQQLIEKQETKS